MPPPTYVSVRTIYIILLFYHIITKIIFQYDFDNFFSAQQIVVALAIRRIMWISGGVLPFRRPCFVLKRR